MLDPNKNLIDIQTLSSFMWWGAWGSKSLLNFLLSYTYYGRNGMCNQVDFKANAFFYCATRKNPNKIWKYKNQNSKMNF